LTESVPSGSTLTLASRHKRQASVKQDLAAGRGSKLGAEYARQLRSGSLPPDLMEVRDLPGFVTTKAQRHKEKAQGARLPGIVGSHLGWFIQTERE
jgi:hypothetical protein